MSEHDDELDLFAKGGGTEAYARDSDPRTAHDAAELTSAAALELIVYKVLKTHGTRMTSLCVMRALGWSTAWSISPRFRPLERKGLIEQAGELVVPNSSGKPRALMAWQIKR